MHGTNDDTRTSKEELKREVELSKKSLSELKREVESRATSRASSVARFEREVELSKKSLSELKREVESRTTSRASSMEWDIQSLSILTEMHKSPAFNLIGDVKAHFEFYPRGYGAGKGTHCSLFVRFDKPA